MSGFRRILRLLWESICPYEIHWGIEYQDARHCEAQLLESPKGGTHRPPMSRPDPPDANNKAA